jgi:ornithine decarboxylase
MGCNFDCASREEISMVLSQGVSPDRIIFANPCKASSHIKYARSEDIDLLTFDNVSELYKIKLYHPKAKLLVRIKVDDSKSLCKFSCKFGASMEELDDIFKLAKASSLEICGVSYHIGSLCKDLETYENAILEAKKVFDMGKKYGFEMNVLDIGGGFPGLDDEDEEDELEQRSEEDSQMESEEELDKIKIDIENDTKKRGCSVCTEGEIVEKKILKFKDIAKIIQTTIKNNFNNENIRVISEPGRYMVATSHTLVLNIVSKKEYLDKENNEKYFNYYLNDGVYGSFNCTIFDHAKPKILPYNERDGKFYKSYIWGNTCDSIDSCGIHYLPDLAIGERVLVENMGAYTTAAATTFNGFKKTECYYVLRKDNS